MTRWTAFPFDAAGFACDDATLKARWARLHQGDAEPWAEDDAVRAAWALYHAGRFKQARDAGLALGDAGLAVANKAQCVHADHLETNEKTRLAMFLEVAERAQAQAQAHPGLASAHYWLAYALGRHGQGVSVARALALGLDARIKVALETAIALAPRHADAHVALGAFHAEMIDRLGTAAAKARGADAAAGLRMFEQALALHPDAATARIEYANGLVMLEGDRRMKQAERLYADAAACTPLDAAEHLEVERAKRELLDA